MAAVEKLVEHFDQLVFGGRPGTSTAKWVVPIRIVLYGEDTDRWRPVVEKHTATLAKLTGLDITVLVEKFWRGNYFIHFVMPVQMYPLLQDYYQSTDPDRVKKWIEGVAGVAFRIPRNSRHIRQAVSIVTTDRLRREVSRTALHEFMHGLGMSYHSEMVHPTITSGARDMFELSVNEKIALRTLYDDRIKPDMWRPHALPVAREIIAELVEEARAEESATAD